MPSSAFKDATQSTNLWKDGRLGFSAKAAGSRKHSGRSSKRRILDHLS